MVILLKNTAPVPFSDNWTKISPRVCVCDYLIDTYSIMQMCFIPLFLINVMLTWNPFSQKHMSEAQSFQHSLYATCHFADKKDLSSKSKAPRKTYQTILLIRKGLPDILSTNERRGGRKGGRNNDITWMVTMKTLINLKSTQKQQTGLAQQENLTK